MQSMSKEWYAAYYVKNREHILSQQAKARTARRQAINFIKSAPCFDCGETYPAYVMDFDHVRGTKKQAIAVMNYSNCPFSEIMEEVSKCDLVCSNCHRTRTYTRRMEIDRAAFPA